MTADFVAENSEIGKFQNEVFGVRDLRDMFPRKKNLVRRISNEYYVPIVFLRHKHVS